jgi:hypothetical protein
VDIIRVLGVNIAAVKREVIEDIRVIVDTIERTKELDSRILEEISLSKYRKMSLKLILLII